MWINVKILPEYLIVENTIRVYQTLEFFSCLHFLCCVCSLFEFSCHVQSWQLWHFCTTTYGNKLVVATRRINFDTNLLFGKIDVADNCICLIFKSEQYNKNAYQHCVARYLKFGRWLWMLVCFEWKGGGGGGANFGNLCWYDFGNLKYPGGGGMSEFWLSKISLGEGGWNFGHLKKNLVIGRGGGGRGCSLNFIYWYSYKRQITLVALCWEAVARLKMRKMVNFVVQRENSIASHSSRCINCVPLNAVLHCTNKKH